MTLSDPLVLPAPAAPRLARRERVDRHEPAVLDLAFEALVSPFIQRLYRFLTVQLGDEREARDALQETLIAAWQGLSRLRDVNDPWPWLAGIAAHKAADVGRRRRVVLPLMEDDWSVETDDHSADVRAALGRLPLKARQILLLRYFLRLSEEETAAALGLRLGTVKSRAARARRLLLGELG
jgi:RNA polymerase sigma-70 factor (ECF subfamily)